MDISATGLQKQPFLSVGKPSAFFSYGGQEKAYEFFEETWHQNNGLGLFQGPPLSGKTTIIKHYSNLIKDDCSIAIINGNDLSAAIFLEQLVAAFGYANQFSTAKEMMDMVQVFIKQQTSHDRPPMLFIENTHAMKPDAMQILCELASVHVNDKSAIRIVLSSDRSIGYIANAPAMGKIAKRLTGNFHLSPLTIDETSDYLYAKMRDGGCHDPDNVFPDTICDNLFHASGGWPGLVDTLALKAIQNAQCCPVSPSDIEAHECPTGTHPNQILDNEIENYDSELNHPLLFLNHKDDPTKKIEFTSNRLTIGRSSSNDISIEGKFLSRHHALLVRHGASTLLMDLNSANGTYVNSRRVSNQVLIHDDVITVGDYSLKFINPKATRRERVESINLDETEVMKTLDNLRQVLADPAPVRWKLVG